MNEINEDFTSFVPSWLNLTASQWQILHVLDLQNEVEKLTEKVEKNKLSQKEAKSKLQELIQKNYARHLQNQIVEQKCCAYTQIKQCEGICGWQESEENYQNKLEQIKNVLRGKTEDVEKWLSQKTQEAAKVGNFALAALWRDRLKMLKNTLESQKIILPQPQNLDLVSLVIATGSDGLEIGSLVIQNIREGRLININNFLLTGSSSELETSNLSTSNPDSDSKDSEEKETEQEPEKNTDRIKNLGLEFLQRFLMSYATSQGDLCPIFLDIWLQEED